MQAEETPIESFVKMTEEHRRERQRRIDAGDETARLKFQRTTPAAAQRPAQGGAVPVLGRPGAAVPSSALKRPYPSLGAPGGYGAPKQPRPTYGAFGGYPGGYH